MLTVDQGGRGAQQCVLASASIPSIPGTARPMTSAYGHIATYLSRVRRRLEFVALGSAIAASAVVLMMTVVVALVMSAALDGVVGWVLLAVGAVAAAVAFWRMWIVPRRSYATDTAIALFVEERIGGLHSAVVTAVQTRDMMASAQSGTTDETGQTQASAPLGFSPQLAAATAEQAAATLLHHPPRGLVVTSGASRWALVALATWVVAVLVVVAVPGFLAQGWAAMMEGDEATAASARTESVDRVVTSFQLHIEPPAYLGLQPRDEKTATGTIRAVVGSTVRYVATPLRPVTKAVVIFASEPDARWEVGVNDAGLLDGALRVGTDDKYRFIVTYPDQVVVAETQWRDVSAVPDGAPSVRLLLPEGDLEVHAKDDVQLVFESSDDFGLASVELVVLGAGGGEVLRRSIATPQGARTARGATTLAVAELKMSPGDSVQVMFEAKDTNTLNGPRTALSAARTLTMYSAEREHEALLKQLERLLDALVGVVADRLETPLEQRDVRRLSSYIETHEGISTKEGLALEALEKLQVALRTDRIATDAFRADLMAAQAALKAAHDHEATQIHKATSPDIITPEPAVLVQLLFVANEDAAEALEGTIFEFKWLLDQARQDRLLQTGREMLEVQQELRELMEKMKSGDDTAKRQAMAKIAQLRQKLAKMQREMMRLAETVPYENQNMSQRAPGEMDDAKTMEDRFKNIERLMQEGKIEEALKELEALNKGTQEMMAGLQNDFRRVAAPSKQGRQMAGDFQQKLNELADQQRGLNAETSEQNRQAGEGPPEASAQAMQEARADAKALADKLASIEPSALHPADKAGLDKLKSDAGRLEEQLSKMDADSAGGTAADIAKKSDGLSKEVGEGASRAIKAEKVASLEAAQKKLASAAAAAKKLAAKLGQGVSGESGAGEPKKNAAKSGDEPSGGQGPKPANSAAASPSAAGGDEDQGQNKDAGKGKGKEGEGKGIGGIGQGQGGQGGRGKGTAGLKALGKRQGKLSKQLGGLAESLEALDSEMPGLRDKLKPQLDSARSKMDAATKELGKGRGRGARQRQDDIQSELDRALKALGDAISKRQNESQRTAPGMNSPSMKVGIPGAADPSGGFREELLKAMKERAPQSFKDHIDKYYKELVK